MGVNGDPNQYRAPPLELSKGHMRVLIFSGKAGTGGGGGFPSPTGFKKQLMITMGVAMENNLLLVWV